MQRFARQLTIGVIASLAVLAAGTAGAAEKTLRIAGSVLPPHQANPFATAATPTITVTSAIYDGLTRLGPDGALKPWLALTWRNIDPLTWRFELRKGVKFSNGVTFDANVLAGVVANFMAPGQAFENLRRELPVFSGTRVIDPYTIEISTKDPTPQLPRWLSILLIHEPGALKTMGIEAFSRAPVATGPFVAEEWTPNRATLKANTTSWRKPKLDKIEILALPDSTARLQAIMTGRLDVATALGPDEAQAVTASGGKVVSWTDGTVNGISLVTTRKLPFNDVRVRQALNMAVNRKALVDILLQGATVAANQPAARSVQGYDPAIPPYPYDPTRARALLAAAGYPDGFSFALETSGTGAAATSVYQQVAADLKKVGVTMEIRMVPTPQFLKDVLLTGEYLDSFTFPWPSSPTLDVVRAVVPQHTCLRSMAWYCDQDFMPTIEAAMKEFDETKAMALRREISARYHDQAAAIFLYEQVVFAGLSKRVTEYQDLYGFVGYDTIDLK